MIRDEHAIAQRGVGCAAQQRVGHKKKHFHFGL